MRLFIAAFVTSFAFCSPALALNVPSLPAGMCALNPANPPEAVVTDYLSQANQGSNTVVAAFADCQELAALRGERREGLAHYGAILVQQLPGGIAMSRADYLQQSSQIMQYNDALIQSATDQAFAAAGDAIPGSGLARPTQARASSRGVLYNGSDVLVFGMEQQHQIAGKPVGVASVAGVTLIGSQTVSVNLYAPLSEQDAFTRATQSLTAYVPALIAANP